MISDKLKLLFGKKEKKLTHTHTHVYISLMQWQWLLLLQSFHHSIFRSLSLFTYICVCVEHTSEDI